MELLFPFSCSSVPMVVDLSASTRERHWLRAASKVAVQAQCFECTGFLGFALLLLSEVQARGLSLCPNKPGLTTCPQNQTEKVVVKSGEGTSILVALLERQSEIWHRSPSPGCRQELRFRGRKARGRGRAYRGQQAWSSCGLVHHSLSSGSARQLQRCLHCLRGKFTCCSGCLSP